SDGQRPGDFELVAADSPNARARERDRGMLVHRKEIGRAKVFVAVGFACVDAARLNRERDGRPLRLRLVELDRSREIGKAAAHLCNQVPYLKRRYGMRLVDGERS